MSTEKKPANRSNSLKDMPTSPLPLHDQLPMDQRPTLEMPRIRHERDTLILASISGITPLPVQTEMDIMIDAAWYRHFYQWIARLSGNNADKVIQLLAFLVIGGSASVVNLAIILFFDVADPAHHNDLVRHLVYSAVATEISLLYNFFLNDRFTFHAMIDQRRSWLQRCIRFHGPASVGFVLTLVLSSVFFSLTSKWPHHAVVSQAFAIIIVTAVNFMMHRFWTYRPSTASVATQ